MKIFVSSVMQDFEHYREAAKAAVELMNHTPVMAEGFGARPYSSQKACIAEVEQCDLFVLLLGARYGYIFEGDTSVTRAEYEAAKRCGKPIFAFIESVEMESKQLEFRQSVEEFQTGYFRDQFSTPEQLKDAIVKALNSHNQSSNAETGAEFEARVAATQKPSSLGWNQGATLRLAALPQPRPELDIALVEKNIDSVFQKMVVQGMSSFRNGYEPLADRDFTGLSTNQIELRIFDDGLITLELDPTRLSEGEWSYAFVQPDVYLKLSEGFFSLLDYNSAWINVALMNMVGKMIGDPPPSGSSLQMRMHGPDSDSQSKLFLPLSETAYKQWIKLTLGRFTRTFTHH